MCCGQKRSQLLNSPAPARTRAFTPSLSANRQGPVLGTRPAPSVMATVPPQPHAGPQTRPSEPVPIASAPQGSVAIRYLERSPVRVQGLGTGRSYEFSPSQSVQNVDARDAASLLSTRFFSRV
jgi:hypothetical protein